MHWMQLTTLCTFSPQLMKALETASRAADASAESMAEARAAALGGISQLCLAIAEHASEQLTPELAERIYNGLLRGLEDYSVDRRGDIGSMYVRWNWDGNRAFYKCFYWLQQCKSPGHGRAGGRDAAVGGTPVLATEDVCGEDGKGICMTGA